jgi:hypothetical protein
MRSRRHPSRLTPSSNRWSPRRGLTFTLGLRVHIPILWEVRVEDNVPVTKERVDVPGASGATCLCTYVPRQAQASFLTAAKGQRRFPSRGFRSSHLLAGVLSTCLDRYPTGQPGRDGSSPRMTPRSARCSCLEGTPWRRLRQEFWISKLSLHQRTPRRVGGREFRIDRGTFPAVWFRRERNGHDFHCLCAAARDPGRL